MWFDSLLKIYKVCIQSRGKISYTLQALRMVSHSISIATTHAIHHNKKNWVPPKSWVSFAYYSKIQAPISVCIAIWEQQSLHDPKAEPQRSHCRMNNKLIFYSTNASNTPIMGLGTPWTIWLATLSNKIRIFFVLCCHQVVFNHQPICKKICHPCCGIEIINTPTNWG